MGIEKKFDVISMNDFNKEQIMELILVTDRIKKAINNNKEHDRFVQDYGVSIRELLKDLSVFTAFGENSTRTNFSFRGAALYCGANVDGFPSKDYTSLKKGETWAETFAMIFGYRYDAIVMRSKVEGLPRWTNEFLTNNQELLVKQYDKIGQPYNGNIPMIINGGDGKNQHPTQTILDLYTMYEMLRGLGKPLDGLKLGLLNDLANGRTISSLMSISHLFNFELHMVYVERFGPRNWQLELLKDRGVKIVDHGDNFMDALEASDIAYHSRPQKERVGEGRDLEKIAEKGRITKKMFDKLGNKAPYLMHPKPVDAVTFQEITHDMDNHEKNMTYIQAANGVYSRIALLALGLGRIKTNVVFNHQKQNLEGITLITLPINPPEQKADPSETGYIKDTGVVIDDIPPGMSRRSEGMLGFEGNDVQMLPTRNYKPGKDKTLPPTKDIIKIYEEYELSNEQLSAIALIAPNATINYIEKGQVVNKFRAVNGNFTGQVICGNDACITNVPHEGVKPLHIIENDKLTCNHCETVSSIPEVYESKRFIYLE